MASSASTKKRQSLSAIEEGAGRPLATRPQLLTQLPGSVFTSPGFIMGLIAVEFLYGLLLFAVMSTSKRHRAEERDRAELHANAGPVEPPLAPKGEAEIKPEPVAEPVAKAETTAAATPEPAKVEAEPKVPKAATSDQPTVAKNEPAKEPTKPADAKESVESGKDKTAVAVATPEPPVEAAPKDPLSIFPALGPLVDPLGDSVLKRGDDTLTIQVAAGPHVFDATRDIVGAPHALAEVDGDFTAQVKILGDFQPGTVPLKGLPFTFQGAGLLVWEDKGNYIRFERASGYIGERFQWLYLESCKDGKPTKPKKPTNVREGAVTLRLERRGNVINYTYSLDGKTFLRVDQFTTTLPRKLSIGIAANNASPRGFSARFADFVLTPSS